MLLFYIDESIAKEMYFITLVIHICTKVPWHGLPWLSDLTFLLEGKSNKNEENCQWLCALYFDFWGQERSLLR